MINKIHEQINVLTTFTKESDHMTIHKIRWQQRTYRIDKLGYYHKAREGRNIHHFFHVSNSNLAFKLQFDTEQLSWWLLEVSDGNPD